MSKEIQVPPDEPDQRQTRLELLHYTFRNRLRKAKRAFNRIGIGTGGVPNFEISWVKGKDGPLEFDTPSSRASLEFAVVMSDFILPGHFLVLEDLYTTLAEISSAQEMQDIIVKSKEELNQVEHALPIISSREGVPKTARDIFIEINQNIVFNNDIAARDFVEKLNGYQTVNTVWKHFHDYCLAVFYSLRSIDSQVLGKGLCPQSTRKQICIYCKSEDAEFKNVEHTMPEALGNETSILPRGYVCNSCNNELSTVEGRFIETLPISMMRLLTANVNKDGRFPSARYDKIHFERTSPNSMKSRSQGGKATQISHTELADGILKINMPTITSRIDYKACARTLAKMALGSIAIERGRNVALEPRYDSARNFVVRGGSFSNWLFVNKTAKPNKGAYCQWINGSPSGTYLFVDLFGAQFVMGLEPVEPTVTVPSSIPRPECLMYDLRRSDAGPHEYPTE